MRSPKRCFSDLNATSKLTIASANIGTKLEFSDVRNEYFTVEFSSPSLTAVHRVWMYVGDGESLAHLFKEMTENWMGWEGVKVWNTTKGDFSLSSTSDKLGHSTLEVELLKRDLPQLWSIKATIEIEAGQLERIAYETKLLFKGY
jgi:Family of unknown function (DUF6228)